MKACQPVALSERGAPRDEGSGLLLALTAAAFIAALGAGLIALASAETTLTASVSEGHELGYGAESGLERGMAALRLTPWNLALSGAAGPAFQGAGPAARPTGAAVNLPAETARQLVARKARRDYTDATADLQEADTEYQRRVRQLYLDLCQRDPAWRMVPVVQEQTGVRPIDDIARDVLRHASA